jgi:hypothetical protein
MIDIDEPSGNGATAPGTKRLAGGMLGVHRHACALFNGRADEFRVLLPFIADGFERGDKDLAAHVASLSSGGDVDFVNRQVLEDFGKTFDELRTLDRLQSYPWRGNVRELQNVIERSVIVCDADEFTVDDSWLSAGHQADTARVVRASVAVA